MSTINGSRLFALMGKTNGKHHAAISNGRADGQVAKPESLGISAEAAEQSEGFEAEAVFNRLLALERKRSERTGDPFVLMVVNMERLLRMRGVGQISHICDALRSQTRETDIPGWYRFPMALGVVFTALGGGDRETICSTLGQKTQQALDSVLISADRAMVDISLHYFPEDYNEDKLRTFESDETLYPDLAVENGSKKLYSALKRGLDLFGSAFGLLLLSPVFLAIAALIKLTSPGPVLFRQRRLGLFGKEFEFLKFRSMYLNNSSKIHEQYVKNLITRNQGNPGVVQPTDKPVFKIVNDPRVTPLGRFLRKSSLDELPQLINVLCGEMSLVGPRPPVPYEVACYRFWHRRRVIEVKPGITGLWQVYGRSRTTFDEMVRLDLKYVREQSFLLDLKILLCTPRAVLTGRGAY